jgi:hypothetical protein
MKKDNVFVIYNLQFSMRIYHRKNVECYIYGHIMHFNMLYVRKDNVRDWTTPGYLQLFLVFVVVHVVRAFVP